MLFSSNTPTQPERVLEPTGSQGVSPCSNLSLDAIGARAVAVVRKPFNVCNDKKISTEETERGYTFFKLTHIVLTVVL